MVHAPPRPAPGLPPVRVNLYSDTQTRPTAAMREAMMAAEVGDEQSGLDPTVNELCDRMAALLGAEAAMFLPSGTMCNEIAILTHCRPGDAVLAHHTAHILAAEGGAPAALAGVQIAALAGEGGQFSPATLAAAFNGGSRYDAPQTLVAVEQTANLGGGTIWPVAALREVADLAHARGMATHMDGARLMNAVVASGIPAAEMVAGYDSVWLDFTKGLGAPLGAVLCGPAAFIETNLLGTFALLEAAARRRDAASRHLCGCVPACARSSHRPFGGRPRQRPRAGARSGADRGAVGADAADQSGVFRHLGHWAHGCRDRGGAAPARGDDLVDGHASRPRLHTS